MEFKTYKIDKSLLNRYIDYRINNVKTEKGYVSYRLIEGDDELEVKKQSDRDITPRRIFFGTTTFTTDDPTVQKFIEARPDFGKKIKIYNPLAENEAKAKEATRQAKLTLASTELDEQQLTAIAFRRFGFETYKFLKEKDYSGLKLEVMQFAMNEPDLFEEYLNDKDNNTTQYYLSMALAKGIIKLINAGGTVVWGDNGSEILKVARGKKALDDLSDFLKTSEGREVRNIINERLSEATVEAEVSKAKQSTKKETAKTE